MKYVVVDIDAGVALADRVAYAAAQQRQLREHFAPQWDGAGEDDEVRAATPATPPLAGEVQVLLHNQPPPDVQGALGVHSRQPDGTPVANIYVGLARQYGEVWTSVASHEVLEVRGDPRLSLCVELADGSIWDREVCDRVEQDTYLIDGVLMSNFNTPGAFEPSGAKDEKFDYLGKSTAANQVRPGGYAQRFDVGKGWTQVGQMHAYRAHLAQLGLGRQARRAARLKLTLWRRIVRAVVRVFDLA